MVSLQDILHRRENGKIDSSQPARVLFVLFVLHFYCFPFDLFVWLQGDQVSL
jgi:hypothetical protein